jgi:hypothetical protein
MSYINPKTQELTIEILDTPGNAELILSMIAKGEKRKIPEALDITLYQWSGRLKSEPALAQLVDDATTEYFLNASERVSQKILDMDTDANARLVGVQQKEAEFIRETLGRAKYSKRSENVNVNLNAETLTDEQKSTLDMLLGKNGSTEPLNDDSNVIDI